MPDSLRTYDEEGADDFIAEHGIDDAVDILAEVSNRAIDDVSTSELSIMETAVRFACEKTASATRAMVFSKEGIHGLPPVRDTVVQCIHRLHAVLDLQALAKEANGAQRSLALLSTNDRLKKHEDAVIERLGENQDVTDQARIYIVRNIMERRALWEERPVGPYFRTRLLYLRDAEKYLDVPSDAWTTIDKAVIEPREGTPWIYRRSGDHHVAAYTPRFALQYSDLSIGYWQQVATREQEEFLFPKHSRDDVHDGLVRSLSSEQLERARANFEMEQYFRGRRSTFPQQFNPEWYALCFADAN